MDEVDAFLAASSAAADAAGHVCQVYWGAKNDSPKQARQAVDRVAEMLVATYEGFIKFAGKIIAARDTTALIHVRDERHLSGHHAAVDWADELISYLRLAFDPRCRSSELERPEELTPAGLSAAVEANWKSASGLISAILTDDWYREFTLACERIVPERARVIEGGYVHFVSLTPEETRQKFCFDEYESGKAYKEINAALRRRGWEAFEDDRGVRGPIKAWGKRIGKQPPKRRPGRPKTPDSTSCSNAK